MSGQHPTREEDFDLYALGALEGEEKRALESHLLSCGSCTQKLAEAQGRIALLAFAAPSVAPSAAVKQRLLAQVRAEASNAVPRSVTGPAPAPRREAEERPSAFGRWWAAVLIPATAVLAIATFVLFNENRRLDHELASLQSTVAQEQQLVEQSQQVADLLASADTITVPLAQQLGMPAGSAHVSYNPKTGVLLYDGALAPAPTAKSYQLWLVPVNGKPISAGVFNPASGMPDHWIVSLPAGTAPKAFAVSLEPAGGVPQPTGPMVLVGPVS